MADFDAGIHSTVYPNAPVGVQFPGDPGFQTGNRPNNTRYNNFAPRLGLAYDPKGNGRMVIRASFGILYDMPHTLFFYNYSSSPPWGNSITIPFPPGGFANPWQGFPGGSPYPVNINNHNFAFSNGGYYESVPLNVKNTYLEQWNLTVQKQVGTSWLLKAAYMGNNTVHLWTDQEQNPGVYIPGTCTAGQFGLTKPGLCTQASNVTARRLLTQLNPSQGPLFGTVELLDDGGTASYQSLVLSAEHRLSQHFMVLANYTWAHCISDLVTTELSGPIYSNPADRRSDRGDCTAIDVRQNFNLSAVLQSPKFTSKALQWIAGDWQLSPIFAVHTGTSFSVTTGVSDPITGIGGQRPNQIAANPYCAVQTISCFLNAAAFATPKVTPTGAFGNLAYSDNLVTAPAISMWTSRCRDSSGSEKSSTSGNSRRIFQYSKQSKFSEPDGGAEQQHLRKDPVRCKPQDHAVRHKVRVLTARTRGDINTSRAAERSSFCPRFIQEKFVSGAGHRGSWPARLPLLPLKIRRGRSES